jgi:hypothetical protein
MADRRKREIIIKKNYGLHPLSPGHVPLSEAFDYPLKADRAGDGEDDSTDAQDKPVRPEPADERGE